MSRIPVRSRALARLSFALLAGLCMSASAAAQTWVQTLPGSAPDTPAEVVFLPQDSDSQETRFELLVHGFWREDVVGGDGQTYQRIRVPGLQAKGGHLGGPELPAARVNIAVPTDAFEVTFIGVDEWEVLTYEALRVYPKPIPGNDELIDPTEDPGSGDTFGTNEVFTIDPSAYTGAGYYPPDRIAPNPLTETFFGVFPGATVDLFPFRWDASTDELRVAAHSEFVFAHGGEVGPQIQISKHKNELAKMTFVNWEAVQFQGWSISALEYHGRYAIVTGAMFDAALFPFINHKKALGFEVTVIHHAVGASRTTILGDVQDWYLKGDPSDDHYLLIIGDTIHVPLGSYTPPGTTDVIPTDDDFGTPLDGDFHKEVFVGRLSVDSPADLTNQINKIITYETAPVPGGRYDRALLVAHKEGAPGKYEGAHEDVRTATYTTQPVFVTKYGSGLGPNDSQVSFEIDQGTGVVAYRGHGSTNAWTNWNAFSDNYHKNDVIGLSNPVHPVVWAITCTNSNLGTQGGGTIDCISETWMEEPLVGASASYGATVTTSTTPNHELDRRLFEAVYRGEITVHGQAIAYAEQHVNNIWPGHRNPWAYLLLGDPAMRIRREVPALLSVAIPSATQPCEDQGCGQTIDVQVFQDAEPADGALVSLFKPSLIPGLPDEVLVNRYTNESGEASLPVSLSTPGPMSWSVQSEDGNVSVGEIDVEMGSAWQSIGTSVPGTNGPLSLVGVGTLQGGTFVTSILTNARENSSAILVLGVSQVNAPFKGGTLVPSLEVLIFGIPTGPFGVINLPSTWPMDVPSGISFYEQYWMTDPAGPVGFASSNAISGTTP